MDILWATVKGSSVYSSTQLQLTMDAGFWDNSNSRAINQSGFTVLVTKPNTLTQLLIEQAIADAVVDFYNNGYYQTSFDRDDVILVNGGVVLFSL